MAIGSTPPSIHEILREKDEFEFRSPPFSLSLSRSLPRTFARTLHLSKLAAAVLRVSAVRFALEPRARGAGGAIGRRSMELLLEIEGKTDSRRENYEAIFSNFLRYKNMLNGGG